ncbi:hypothetical protein [Halobacillus campisalis]|uniref:Uncharacterized protein n=1 Tax=Halobacillus campisalis TaxID=435909 RepID=A0ABW2K7C3_9BACI|nr:hypothetical protein [Halobacillus campisalis]
MSFLYAGFGVGDHFHWAGGIGLLFIIFVWYRNRWQLLGRYTGVGKEKLSGE